ncbi:MAG: hypothetical protein KDK53_16950 [Maritimibacter sp.]|nr:hypothetical protein [Maritimibacter sp.]
MREKNLLRLRIDYDSESNRDDNTYTFDLTEIPEIPLKPTLGIPDDRRVGVFYDWGRNRTESMLNLQITAQQFGESQDSTPDPKRTLSVEMPNSVVFAFISAALENGNMAIEGKEAGKLLVSLGEALQRQGDTT